MDYMAMRHDDLTSQIFHIAMSTLKSYFILTGLCENFKLLCENLNSPCDISHCYVIDDIASDSILHGYVRILHQ
jgi:hypothetical protein